MSQLDPLAQELEDQKVRASTSPSNPHEAIYTPLGLNQVRFIEILPSDTEEAPVRCLLRVVELGPDVRYAALSYVWGDPRVTREIIVNGVLMPVTVNLESALRQFSKTGFPVNKKTELVTQLWVDAVCINQQDIPERNRQVTMMSSIYRNATSVLSWLGPPDENRHDLALRTIYEVVAKFSVIFQGGPHSSYDFSEMVRIGFEWMVANLGPFSLDRNRRESVQWWALRSLSSNAYWSRMWIIQELALVKDLWEHLFICGSESIPALVFMAFQRFLLHCRGSVPPNLNGYNANAVSVWEFLSDYRLSGIPLTELVRTFRMKIGTGEGHLVHRICLSALRASATNPRDFVYAIIGLMPNNIKPDYSKPVRDVYLDAILSAGITQCLLPCLRLSGCGYDYRNDHNLPSWLPEFSKLHTGFALPAYHHESILQNIELQLPEITQQSTLRVQGVTYSRVKLVKSLRFRDTNKSYKKYIQQICIEYLSDFTDLGSYENDEDRLSYLRTNRPLRVLMEVLSCDLKGNQVTSTDHQNPSTFNHVIYFWANVIRDELTNEEKKTAMERLGVPAEMSLDKFLAISLTGMTNVSFWVGLQRNCKFVGVNVSLYYITMAHQARCRTLFQTDKGQLGIGPPNLQAGDIVCALDKCKFPSLLRKHGSSFQHVGICKVAGLSSMNPADMIEKGEIQVETFEID